MATTAATAIKSKRVHDNMIDTLQAKHLHQFLDKPKFVKRGIEMLKAVLVSYHLNNQTQCLIGVRNLSSLSQGPKETTAAFFGRIRGFSSPLRGVTLESLLSLFVINSMDQDA